MPRRMDGDDGDGKDCAGGTVIQRPPAPDPPLRLGNTVWPVWSARLLAMIALAGAVAMPWLATWQGALRRAEHGANAFPVVDVPLRPELVELPGGVFVMGSPASEQGRTSDEERHSVEIHPFAVCRTEVTVAQWIAIMGSKPKGCDGTCQPLHPAQGVSFYDAVQYLNRLTDAENGLVSSNAVALTRCYDEWNWVWDRSCTGYRLLTEAEWEYAARAGTMSAYGFGEESKEACQFANGSASTCNDSFDKLAPVGSFRSNAWGIFDMHGNVYEWVWDEQWSRTAKSTTNGKMTAGVRDSDRRGLRGGSFLTPLDKLRSASRSWDWPGDTDLDYGVRCARSLATR